VKSHQPADAGGEPQAELHLGEVGDRWAWRWVEPASGIELHSNETFATREGAKESARGAYPDVPFAGEEEDA
jgi:hypothetical protein